MLPPQHPLLTILTPYMFRSALESPDGRMSGPSSKRADFPRCASLYHNELELILLRHILDKQDYSLSFLTSFFQMGLASADLA
jgi:hypothetical protein